VSESFTTKTELPGVIVIRRTVFGDERGFFRETYRQDDIGEAADVSFTPVQANHSRSGKHTLRGIHVAPWHKLITVTRGQVQQVVLDARPGSPTFGRHVSLNMGEADSSGADWCSVFVPAGCGNAFLVRSDVADYTYLASEYWQPGLEKDIVYSDPDLAIAWQDTAPNVSERDQKGKRLRDL
jgi:dTDP-4-dehydrorhamnose 3,5-epimerase